MPLSKDPEKAQRQLANLRKGPVAAAQKRASLAVVPYADPPATPPPTGDPSPHLLDGNEDGGGSGGLWVMIAAGVGLLLVLVVLSRRAGAPSGR